MPNFQLNLAMGTHKGIIREHNEDAVGYHYPENFRTLTEKGALFVIADGVGGLTKGEQASQYAVNRIIELYYLSSTDLNPRDVLQSCIEQVNSEVFSKYEGQSATTIVATVIRQSDMVVAYVGDSRAYIFDGQGVQQQTKDHVSLISKGNRKHKSKLTRAIGHRHVVEVDVLEATVLQGQAVLLLTDGAIPYFTEDELGSLMRYTPVDIVTRIINGSNQRGGRDNISTIMIAIAGVLEDDKALQRHLDQLPAPVELVYPAQATSAPLARGWLLIPTLIFILLLVGSLVYSQVIDPLEDSPPQLSASPEMIATALDTIDSQNVPVTITHEPDTLSSITGQTIIFDDVAITYTQLDGDTSAFLIVPDKAYSLCTLFTDDNDHVWYQIYDEETDRKGWIDEADLPSHTLSD